MSFSSLHVFSPRVVLRAALPAALSVWLVWMFSAQLVEIDFLGIKDTLSTYGWSTWCLAGIFTWISFAAVSGYDPIVKDILGFDIPKRRAAAMSWKATAISQLVGFGVITGTLVRWLELGLNPNKSAENTATQAFKLTLTVSLSFLIAWGAVTAVASAVILLDPIQTVAAMLGICGLLVAGHKSGWPLVKRLYRLRRKSGLFVFLTFIDTLFAAFVIYAFLPVGLAPFSVIYLAFLLSYIVGLVSGLPGGFGPFEICMIALLPNIDPSLLAPALVGFRLSYFAVPAIIAMVLVGLQLLKKKAPIEHGVFDTNIPRDLRTFAPPEADWMRGNKLTCFMTASRTEACLTYQTTSAIVQMGDPFGKTPASNKILEHLRNDASWSKRGLSLYRCNRLTAIRAGALGMRNFNFSSEAILRPAHFTLDVPSMSGLRRKLRKAKSAGATINSQRLNLDDLSALNDDWVADHGQARGFSTGQFTRDAVARQRVYVAYQNGTAIAFVSFSTSKDRWLLDLIRYRSDCADGAVYSLIAQAVEDARLCNVDALSLGSVPFCPQVKNTGAMRFLSNFIFRRSPSLKGLYQFKKHFDPDWQDRYFVTGTLWGGLIAAVTIYGAIFVSGSIKKNSANS